VAHSAVELWHGRRVLALDGTTLRVPDVPECAAYFGGMHTACGKFRPLARATALFDVARECFTDASLGGYADDERSLAAHHLPRIGPQDLLVMDRGFPSRPWLGKLVARALAFCVRMGRCWDGAKRFLRSGLDDTAADLGTREAPLSLRLLRVLLPNGSIFVLATNMFDPTLGPADFAAPIAADGASRKPSSSSRRACTSRTERHPAPHRRTGLLRLPRARQLCGRARPGRAARRAPPARACRRCQRLVHQAQPHARAQELATSPASPAARARLLHCPEPPHRTAPGSVRS
jgi:DDE family transposase